MSLIKEIPARRTPAHIRSSILMGLFAVLALTGACAPRKPSPPAPAATRPPSTPYPPPAGRTAGQMWLHPIDDMPLLFIPAGPFEMGAEPGEPDIDPSETPLHTVYLDAFWIDQLEVSNRMYALCVQEGRCTSPSLGRSLTRPDYYENLSYAEHPVVNVTWQQAADYCTWAGRRLPTEAEWEKAARGTEGQTFPWGEDAPNCSLLMFGDPGPGSPACGEDTFPAGSFPAGASPYGALDMAGNVWEWTADWYSETWYAQSAAANPTGPATGKTRVLRGGSLSDSSITVRAANRHHTAPENPSYLVGFRCAISADP